MVPCTFERTARRARRAGERRRQCAVWCALWFKCSSGCSSPLVVYVGRVARVHAQAAEGGGAEATLGQTTTQHAEVSVGVCVARTCSPFHDTHLSLTPLGMAIFLLRSGHGAGGRSVYVVQLHTRS